MRAAPMPPFEEASVASSGRRNCNYRRDPAKLGAPRSKGRPQPLFGGGVRLASSSASGSFLRIGNQSATSFAAAISPLPPARRKKHVVKKHKHIASRPLLGAPTEGKPTMKTRLSPKRKPSSGARSGSLSSAMSKAAKRVASLPSKVTSRKKRSTADCKQDLGMAPPLCKYETIDTCKASSRSSSPLFDEEVKFAKHLEEMEAARQNDPLQKGCHNEADDGFSHSSPLCFSLDNVLSPSGPLHFNEEDSSFPPGFQEFPSFLRQSDASGSSLFVNCASPAPVSPLDGDGDVTEGGPDNSTPTLCDQLRLSTDMSPEPEGRHGASPAPLSPSKRPVNLWHKARGKAAEEIETTQVMGDEDLSTTIDLSFVVDEPPAPDANTKEAADSTLAWGALSMLLGSPAPTSVKKKKRRQPVNLWLDDSASVGDDLEDIMLPSQDDNELGGNIPDLEIDEDADDDCSIPCMAEETTTDNDAVPQLDCVVPDLDDAQDLPLFAPTTPEPSKKDIADSTLAWTALAAILGSPAPSSVAKKRATKARTNLWEDSEVEDLLPEILPGPEDEAFDNEGDCVPSVELGEPIDLEELLESEDTPGESTRQEETAAKKEAADSVLAWSALGMLLGSPTPKAVAKKSRKPATNLWGDVEGASEEDLDDLVLGADGDDATTGDEDEEAEDSSHGIPSLSGTVDEEDDDDHSIPSLSADSPVTVGAADLVSAYPKLESSAKKEAADSVLAWSALGMLLGSPAPKATQPRRQRRGAQPDLWSEDDAIVTNLFKSFSLDDVAVAEPPCIEGR